MDIEAFTEFAKMDFSKMETFDFSLAFTTPQHIRTFFASANLTSLKSLSFFNLRNSGNVFQELFKTDLPSL